jgi:hypothetical protein
LTRSPHPRDPRDRTSIRGGHEVTKRRIRIQRVTKTKPRDHSALNLDPRDDEIVRAKNQLYATGRPRRTR